MQYPDKKILALVIVFVVLITSTFAYSNDVDVEASATVQDASLSLNAPSSLDFGTIIPGQAQSTVTVDASGGAATPTSSGPASVSGGASGLVNVTTNIDANVTIDFVLTGADTNDTIGAIGVSGTTDTMAVGDIGGKSTATPLAVTVAGPNQIHIGGVLTVGATQASGAYEGTIVCTVDYQ